ncbi:MAG: mannitol dehydrogenase family protein [Pseudomonadales bacterium]|nr:mannitol dehydrogenase family protein [Pseudomonadales bacterium]
MANVWMLTYDAGLSTMRINLKTEGSEHLLLPNYEVSSLKVGILHIGIGAFHRAHQCACFDRLAGLGESGCGVFAVSLQSADVHEALCQQDHRYTLTTLGSDEPIKVIGCIKASAGPEDLDEALEVFRTEELKLVTLTVTEKAYQPGASMVEFLVEGLRRRRQAGLKLVVASCDNLADNGRRLRNLIQESVGAETELQRWIETEVQFPNGMVDSITPRVTKELIEQVARKTGIRDEIPVQREPFTQWVLEHCDLPFDLAQGGVEIVPDVAPYELLKLRVLNASHSLLAYAGVLLGYQTVHEAISDAKLSVVVEKFMIAMVSTMSLPPDLDATDYVSTTLKRFANPGVDHELRQIAEDGTSKLRERVIPALSAGPDSALICLPIVFWIAFVRLKMAAGETLIDPLSSELSDEAATLTELLGVQNAQVLRHHERLELKGIEDFLGEMV